MRVLSVVILVIAAFLFFFNLQARDFWAPDEGDFAQIVRELDTNLVVPHLNGTPYAEKPPLFYYLLYGSKQFFGASRDELRLRVPSALFSLLIVIAVLVTARRFFGAPQGCIAAMILITTPLFYWQARFLQVDMVFATFVSGTMMAFFWFSQRGKKWLLYLTTVFLAFAFMTKGPLALALSIPPMVIQVIYAREKALLRPRDLLLPFALFLAVVIPWYIAVYVKEGLPFLYENVVRQNFTRFFQAWSHKRPFYYYFTTLPLDAFPWIVFFPLGLVRAVKAFKTDNRLRYFLLWFAWMFLFLSLSSGKISKYMLPLLPALSMLTAVSISDEKHRYNRIAFGLLVLLFFILGALLLFFRTKLYPEFAEERLVLGAFCITCSFFLALFFRLKKPGILFLTLSGFLLAAFCTGNAFVYQKWNALKSPRKVGERLADLTSDGTPWVYYGSMRGVYVYYSGKLALHVDEHDREGLKTLGRSKQAFYLLTRKRDIAEVTESLRSVTIISEYRIGDTSMIVARYRSSK